MNVLRNTEIQLAFEVTERWLALMAALSNWWIIMRKTSDFVDTVFTWLIYINLLLAKIECVPSSQSVTPVVQQSYFYNPRAHLRSSFNHRRTTSVWTSSLTTPKRRRTPPGPTSFQCWIVRTFLLSTWWVERYWYIVVFQSMEKTQIHNISQFKLSLQH